MNSLFSERIHHIDTSEIRKVFDLAAKIKNPLNLSIGQPDFPLPQPVEEAMIQAIRDKKTGYTPTTGLVELRQAIADRLLREKQVKVSPENVIVSTGVASILFLLFQTIINENDHVLMIDPYFLIYPALIKYHRAHAHTLPENFTGEDVDRLTRELSSKNIRLKLIIFASPSNPTGKILSVDQLKALARLAEKQGAVVASDEIYDAFDYEAKHVSMATILPDQTLTLNGFSKSHAMTGLRVGYLAAPTALSEVVQKMATLQQYSMVCAPQPAQWAAIVGLSTPITTELALMKKRRDLVYGLLKECASLPYPDGAFYMYPSIPVDSAQFVEMAIQERLLVVPGYIFSANRKSIRISYAQKEAVLEEGCAVFKKLVERSANA